jgi:2-polyprenyl-6-methoxyphenol hydroxylase and related FAD-dependent oxidoreductases
LSDVSKNIVIIGAGIGGLTSSLVLARAGHNVTLVERSTGFSEVGAGLQLSPNVSRLLVSLGLGPALQRAATEPDRVVIRSARSGSQIGEIALGSFMRETFQSPYWVIHRADLQTTLLDAVRSESSIQLLVGRTLEAISQNENGVELTVKTAGGTTETLHADLVIGADGVRSAVRKAIGDSRDPVYRGYVAWRTTVDTALAPPTLPRNETGLWLGPRGHVVHYPVKNGKKINIIAVERRAKPVDGWTAPGDVKDLLSSYGSIAPELRKLLSCQKEWLLWSLADIPAKKMAEGRIALLGDAAHPVLPFLAQGAALAIEDSFCLAQELNAFPEDIPAALASYQNKRLGRAIEVQTQSRRNGKIYHAPAPIAIPRNMVMKKIGPTGMVTRYSWLYGFKQDGAK